MDILQVKNVWINYKTINSISYRELFNPKKMRLKKNNVFTAVKNVSFNLKRRMFGHVGANGSGKSTLLRGIANIYSPDKGEINRYCDKVSLLSLGIGFQTRLPGRQNIILSGLAMGFSKKEIHEKMEEIIEFSELEDFIDKPVKTYSSGMYSKLAFSISVMLKTDLLLIDEVLSVGDMNFRKKSNEKLREIIGHEDQSVIIVSHDLSTISSACNRVAWLDHGELQAIGESGIILEKYSDFMNRKRK